MKRILVVCVLTLAQAGIGVATAAEGKLNDAPSASPEATRTASYGGSVAALETAEGIAHGERASSGKRARATASATKRAAAPTLAPESSHFWFHDAGSKLVTDRDVDGYASEITIRFDADTDFIDADVYAALYIRRIGDNDWTLYHTTDDFTIDGHSDSDDYFVTTTLDDGFPTSDYDILVDLYESGRSGIVATIGPYDDGSLTFLPLEETGLDVPIELPGFDIHDVRTTLLEDADGDGHYSKFRIAFDPDAEAAGSWLYAVIWVRAQGGDWIREHVSDDFLVDASGDRDAYALSADWLTGYPTGFYDVQIDLHEAASGALVASAGSERPELSRVPLEDRSRDRVANAPAPGPGPGGGTSSSEHGGGAMTELSLIALLLLSLARRILGANERRDGQARTLRAAKL